MSEYNKFENNSKENSITQEDEEEWYLLGIQKNADIICIISDILSYIATIESIELIYSRYNDTNYSDNPDIPTLQSAILLFLTRLIYTQIAFIRFNHVYEKKMNGEITYSLQPNMDINTSNILKTIGAFYSVIAAIGIYYRDISQPIFGI